MAGSVQFLDLGTYDHTLDGGQLGLDLNRPVLVLAGVSHNFLNVRNYFPT